MKSLVTFVFLAAVALAEVHHQAAQGQCGGLNWSGPTTCVSGYTCKHLTDYYSQCVPAAVLPTNQHKQYPMQCHPKPVTETTMVTSTTKSGKHEYHSHTLKPIPTSSAPMTMPTSSAPMTMPTMGPHSTTVVYSHTVPHSTVVASPSTTNAPPTTTKATTTTTTTVAAPTGTNSVCPHATKFKYFGVNQSGAEFTPGNCPGQKEKDYTWPVTSSLDYFLGHGFNTIRIPFLMERMSPTSTGMGGPFDSAYLGDLKKTVNYITGKGGYAVIDPHNYMRYNGAIITDTTAFQSWWAKLATEFKDNDKVIFDINNEPYGLSAEQTLTLMQAGVHGIRSCGATTQLILVSGTSYTGAWSWETSGNSACMAKIHDPYNNWAVQMHQYLDSDASGTNPTCVSTTIGRERLQAATEWCKSNKVKCFLGEIGAGSNQVCVEAVSEALCAIQQAEGTWIGALWWAGGPWWHDYFQSIEPPNGPAITRILPEALMPYM